ncbi:Subtilisin E precursor [Posidoniimonas corsicana]|uniref:Subtilisin E n=1 Tax=Posidoniimonas corsicana TaxID=1938618 RepID=A0A5C5V7G2_9BACT|nr:S8 family serine peptidase [Posidoniimonas corsicana]TWT34020.1 Subtilisin E precursor [Posidoniimonas corsicana]
MSKKSPNQQRRSTARRSQVETLESREVMSADPLGGLLGGAISHHALQEDAPPLMHHGAGALTQPGGADYSHHADPNADFWLDEQPVVSLEEQLDQIEKSLASAHQQTGMDQVKASYGFSGIGQTVAVIDSGIAYDHYALGGGLGSNYRVVGGYDFTESDSDPYDDGTEGSHGTHVAGIVGADDGNRSGVAPGVDLVGLRVFADNGAGYFSWVESALRWVHENRNAFENPITAVNLSLGTSWNSSSIPAWGMLEDEFAQLKADGIFVSVSAGNSYTSYNEPGLSYPAASPHVVPVMSSDDSGFLSYFSQRHGRAIAAPGRYIYSTIPDYAGNNNGVTDDWANFSGTSMAAPYVAGASVIIREAMEFVGMTGITQDTIFDHMMATAESFYDTASDAWYSRLNVQAAIDALMPEDDFGSSVEEAYNLGTISAGPQANAAPMSGHIERLTDSDYFTFTAGATGTVTFYAQNTTHQLAAAWDGMGADGWSSDGGATYTLNVVAGQQYTVALSSSDGLGYYDLSFSAESTFTYTDWGAASVQETRSGISIAGESFFRIEAGRAGFLTVQGVSGAESVGLSIYDASMNLIKQGGASDRIDVIATAGQELYLRVDGTSSDLDLRLTNALSVVNGQAALVGSAGDDNIVVRLGETLSIAFNGVGYGLSGSAYPDVAIDAANGNDSVTVYGTSGDETVVMSKHSASVTGGAKSVVVENSERINVIGNGGADSAMLHDSAQNDIFVAYSDRAYLSGIGFFNYTEGFSSTVAVSTGGADRATFYDTAGDEVFHANVVYASMTGAGYTNRSEGFVRAYGYASGGTDSAVIGDTSGNDAFQGFSDRAYLSGGATFLYSEGFDAVDVTSSSGADSSFFHGDAGDDVFVSDQAFANLTMANTSLNASGFTRTYAFGNGGSDTAVFSGASGSVDTFTSFSNRAYLANANRFQYAEGFGEVTANASGASDLAIFYGTVSNESVVATPTTSQMTGGGFTRTANGFSKALNYSGGGTDSIVFYDSAGNDFFNAKRATSHMSGAGYLNYASGFAHSQAFSQYGSDIALLTDWAGTDMLSVSGADATLVSGGVTLQASGFGKVDARGENGGVNSATVGAYDGVFNLLGDWT